MPTRQSIRPLTQLDSTLFMTFPLNFSAMNLDKIKLISVPIDAKKYSYDSNKYKLDSEKKEWHFGMGFASIIIIYSFLKIKIKLKLSKYILYLKKLKT